MEEQTGNGMLTTPNKAAAPLWLRCCLLVLSSSIVLFLGLLLVCFVTQLRRCERQKIVVASFLGVPARTVHTDSSYWWVLGMDDWKTRWKGNMRGEIPAEVSVVLRDGGYVVDYKIIGRRPSPQSPPTRRLRDEVLRRIASDFVREKWRASDMASIRGEQYETAEGPRFYCELERKNTHSIPHRFAVRIDPFTGEILTAIAR